MSTVWFMVDDTDPRFNYTGTWSDLSFAEGSPVSQSITGPGYNNTWHYTTDNATVNFRFNGSSYLGVYGSLDNTGALEQDDVHARGNGTQLPDVSCFLDGRVIETVQLPQTIFPAHNIIMCRNRAESSNVSSFPGEHELEINIKNLPNSTGWLFDYITFESLGNPTLNGEILQAGNGLVNNGTNYSMLTFGPGWSVNPVVPMLLGELEPDGSRETGIPNSNASVTFNGTSLTLYGDVVNFNVSNTASYQIDNEPPVEFHPAQQNSDLNLNLPLFTVSNLSVGEHTVVVTFLQGDPTETTLDISYFYVTSLTATEQASLTSPSPFVSPSPTHTTPSMSPSSHKAAQSVGLVVGAVLGTLIPIILFTVAAMLWWRNHKRKKALTHLAAEPFISLNFPENKILPNWLSAMQSMKFPSSKGQPMTNLVEQNSSGSTIEQLNAANALTMKLQQRLAVIQEQNQQRSTQPMVHTDSGLRLTEEAQQDAEVPPGYTAD